MNMSYNSKNMLTNKYIKTTKHMKIWPIVSNWSPYLASTNFNNKNFFNDYFHDRTKNPGIVVAGGDQSMFCFTEDKMYRVHMEAFQKFFKNRKQFKDRVKKFDKLSQQNDVLYKKWTYGKISGTASKELNNCLEETKNIMWNMNGITWFVSMPFDKNICLSELTKIGIVLNEKELDDIWEKGTEPIFDSFDKTQTNHILRLLENRKKWNEISEECQYFFTDYFFNTKSLKICESELKQKFGKFKKSEDARKELLKLHKEKKAKIVRYKKWISTLSKKQKDLVEYFQVIMETRDKRKNAFNKALTIHHRIAEKIFAEAGVSHDLIPFYTIQEIKLGVKYLKKNIKKIQSRKKGFAVYFDERGKIETGKSNFDKDLKKLQNHYLKSHEVKNSSQSSEIKGSIGSSGYVRGVVKIIIDAKKDGYKLNKNEILVTGMTRPEFVPLMKKALAIITDEGGITCHAAIVSRELKKPCIIGTKIATNVLKDGDMVEVDANRGIVRILK